MKKFLTLEEYLAEHEFLKETADFYLRMEKDFAGVKPLEFPPREKILELVRAEKIPLLQQDEFQTKIIDALETILPKDLSAELFVSLIRQENSAVKEFCEARALNEPLTRKIIWGTVEKLIPAELKLWEREEWQENFCPICGRRPVMAWLKKLNEGRARYLLCGGCRTLWNWRRVGCPYCGNLDLEKIRILEVDDKQTVRLDVCEVCSCYLKTYGEDDEENIYLRDWTTLHLDLLAEEHGFQKCGAVELE